MASVHHQLLAPTNIHYYNEDPTLLITRPGRQHSWAPIVGVAGACFVLASVVTFLPTSNYVATFVTTPRVQAITQQVPLVQRVSSVNVLPQQDTVDYTVGLSGAAGVDDSVPVLPTNIAYKEPTSPLKWALAALATAVLPLVFIYNKSLKMEDCDSDADCDSVYDEELEQEAWAMAAVVGSKPVPPEVATVVVKDASGSSAGTDELKLRTAGVNSMHVVHRKLVAELANKRQSNAHTKTRAEVSGGGKKPYKQKGTGNARKGSTRSPLMRGGGVAFGPRNTKNYKQSINRKEGQLAISSLLQNRAPMITVVKGLENAVTEISTKNAVQWLEKFKTEDAAGDKILVVVEDQMPFNEKHPLYLSLRNVPTVHFLQQRQLNVNELLWPNQILISENAMSALKTRYSA